MNLQGSQLVNTAWIDAAKAKIEAARSCEDLEKEAVAALASLLGAHAGATSKLAELEPVLELLTAPGANPTDIVTWIGKLIDYVLGPIVAPVAKYTAQLVIYEAKIAELAAAATAKAAEIESCSIIIPGL